MSDHFGKSPPLARVAGEDTHHDAERHAPGDGSRGGVPAFRRAIAAGGYAWWYIDAISDDGAHALTLIAMIGSVFSPFYARARAEGRAHDPLDFSAMNVAVYGPRDKLWSLNERARGDVHRDDASLSIGASALRWDGDALVATIVERTTPFGPLRPLGSRSILGTVRLHPRVRFDDAHRLDAAGAHHWWCVAPIARVEVDLQQPRIRWSGDGYHDANAGDSSLEGAFRRWHWSRATSSARAVVLYDTEALDGARSRHARRVSPDGRVELIDLPQRVELPRTRWLLHRETRADLGADARVLRPLEDTPFYARSVLATRLSGSAVHSVHESLDLTRFTRRWVQTLLPFRTRQA